MYPKFSMVRNAIGHKCQARALKTLTSAEFMQTPRNEPVLEYRAGSEERKLLDQSLQKFYSKTVDVPIVIGSEEIRTQESHLQPMPFEHSKAVSKYYYTSKELIEKAINNGLSVRKEWERRPLKERADILLKAADLAAGKYRMDLNAATMLGQGKTVVQAEIDSACEIIDFFRFNVHFAFESSKYKPLSAGTVTNKMIYRGLEGFIAAIAPFNFTAIGANLCTAPALMGNVVLWKPSGTAVLSSYIVFQILREAGLPPGIINFIPSQGAVFGDTITNNPNLAGINFTGSVPTFRGLWRQVGQNLEKYKTFPRLVGETGGKNFHFIHSSADIDAVVPNTIRAAFEYQGQKCSACARMYVPQSKWPEIKSKLTEVAKKITVGSPMDPKVFMSSVIDKKAFERITSYIEHAKNSSKLKIIAGGEYDSSKGFFVQPTIVECTDPNDKIFTEEIFGPVLSVYPYPDEKCDEVLKSVKTCTPFSLTGAVFAQDKKFLEKAFVDLREACGNFYINDKCTGAVVGQQPFGGAGLSGTNDKAGGPTYVLRWASPWTVKENSKPSRDWRYPSMD
jgi:1-pyrroline-5-carboxylate dehydrogenase